MLRQVRSGELDESRLLPSAEKRARDVGKKLDRPAAHQGWYRGGPDQAASSSTSAAGPPDLANTSRYDAGRWDHGRE